MIFDHSSVSFQILDVLYMEQENALSINKGRNFDALSFRIEADTIIEYEGKRVDFWDNTIGFFPSNTNYTRRAKKEKMIVVNFKVFDYHTNEIERFIPEESEKYRALFEEMLACWQGKGTAYKYKSAAILYTIFAELYSDSKAVAAEKSKIQPSLDYIEQNYLKCDFSLAEAAEKSYLSPTYFRRVFKAEKGVSPKQYIISRRINYAASLILTGYYSLLEVSETCGYTDYKHFSAEFKKLLGVSPSRYVYKKRREN